MTQLATQQLTPYSIEVSDDDLADLRARLARTRFADDIPGSQGRDGVSAERVRRLVTYWLDGYDWRHWEARLNANPQFVTEIDDQPIHFLHLRSSRADALPLVLTHGWPGSVVEYLDALGPLSDRFHLVVPSLPGYGWSGPTGETGWTNVRIAHAWLELMTRLGYERFGAVGNDAGSMISPEIARISPERVVGVHVTQLFSFPSGDPAEMDGLSEADQAGLQVLQWFWQEKGAFNVVQSQQPQTLAHALVDSPAGLLGWLLQLFDDDLDDDFVLTNAATYWFTGTAGSALRLYYENAHAEPAATEPTDVPVALAMAEGDFQSIRRFSDRDHRQITSWRTLPPPARGHYTAHTATDALVADVERFFDSLA